MEKKDKHKFLKEVKKVLDDNDIFFWLESGTLLGAYRDKELIEWDKDIDLSVRRKDQKKIIGLENKLQKIGRVGTCIRTNGKGENYISSHYIIKKDMKILYKF